MVSVFKRLLVAGAIGVSAMSAHSAAVVSVLGYGLDLNVGYGQSASAGGGGTASVDPPPFSVPAGLGFPGAYPAVYDGMALANASTGTLRALAQATSLEPGTPFRYVESSAKVTGQVTFQSDSTAPSLTTFAFDVDGTLSADAFAYLSLGVRRQGEAYTYRTVDITQAGAFDTTLGIDLMASDGDVFDLIYEIRTTALANYSTGGVSLADLSNSGHVRFGLADGTSLSGTDGFLQALLGAGGSQNVPEPGTLALVALAGLAGLARRAPRG